jgi:radical SAM superfamily enzyme YgiQ (UPF0313 family)
MGKLELKKMLKIDIIVVYIPRYRCGHEVHFVPPITGIHLAAITPPQHHVRVVHQQIEEVNSESDSDVVALSFFSGFAPEAYRLARLFRQKGKIVIAGGPHATFAPDEVAPFCDALVVGEAESVWPQLLADIEAGRLQKRYTGEPQAIESLPTPRYDLLPPQFFITRVVQATRGCPFSCSFCTVPTLNPGFRTRSVENVVNDIAYDRFPHWWQRKLVWFWDDNLTIQRDYVKRLLTAMIPYKRWWLTQASMDIANDPELLDLMRRSGCIGIFFGLESFAAGSLAEAGKRQNQVKEYRRKIAALHRHGICVMAGLIAGFDGDTPDSIRAMVQRLYEVGVDVPFISILTPYKGTELYARLASEGRLLPQHGWEFYNGYNVSFVPKNMSSSELLAAHRDLWKKAFSLRHSLKRLVRAFFTLRLGAFLMCSFMNVFYCLKALRGNTPLDMAEKKFGK